MSIIGTLPVTIRNGDLEDATVVMALLAFIQSQTNANACPATSGTPILKGNGTGGTTAAVAGVDYAVPGATGADGRYPIYAGVAGGSADALTATINPCGITVLYDGMLITVDATSANATTVPTLNLTLGTTASGVLAIKKYNLVPLSAGDIIGARHRLILGWSVSANAWLLLNPGTVTVNSIVGFTDGRYPIYVGAAGGSADALTATINPCGITALYDGMIVSVSATSANATTAPTFNLTLGTTATGVHTIEKNALAALVAGDIAGSGHRLLLEWNAGDSVWMLLNPLPPTASGVGFAQTWQDVSGSRAGTTVYTNSTTVPIMVSVGVNVSGVGTATGFVGAITAAYVYNSISATAVGASLTFIVPAGAAYHITLAGAAIASWAELR